MRLSLAYLLLLSALLLLVFLVAGSQARDSDEDGIDDSIDLDDDNDGLLRYNLGFIRWRNIAGIPDVEDPDDDNDGIPDYRKMHTKLFSWRDNFIFVEDDDWHGELWNGPWNNFNYFETKWIMNDLSSWKHDSFDETLYSMMVPLWFESG